MATANKITSTNHLPGEGNDRFPVYSKQFNELVDVVNDITDGTSSFDTISELTDAAGVTIDGVLLKDSTVKTDTIVEKTSAAGVTLDGTKLKDGGIILVKGVVTQLTGITTGVEVNAPAGVITTVSSTLAAGSNATFIVTNSFVTETSVVQLTVDDSATAGLAKLNVQTVGNGVFSINVTNIHSANAFNNVLKIHFLIV